MEGLCQASPSTQTGPKQYCKILCVLDAWRACSLQQVPLFTGARLP